MTVMKNRRPARGRLVLRSMPGSVEVSDKRPSRNPMKAETALKALITD